MSYLDKQYSPENIAKTLEVHRETKLALGKIAKERANDPVLNLRPDSALSDHRSERQVARDAAAEREALQTDETHYYAD